MLTLNRHTTAHYLYAEPRTAAVFVFNGLTPPTDYQTVTEHSKNPSESPSVGRSKNTISPASVGDTLFTFKIST